MDFFRGLDYDAAVRAVTQRKPRKRTVITDKHRSRVEKLARQGAKNGVIAGEVKISEQSVLAIKRELGLTRKYRA